MLFLCGDIKKGLLDRLRPRAHLVQEALPSSHRDIALFGKCHIDLSNIPTSSNYLFKSEAPHRQQEEQQRESQYCANVRQDVGDALAEVQQPVERPEGVTMGNRQ